MTDWQLTHFIFNFFVGGALGYMSGMLGIGGGLLVLPLLTLAYGLDQQLAHGTSLILMAPNMIIGFWQYRRRNPITLKMAALIGGGAVVASYGAALVAAQVSGGLLRTLVAVFMIGLAANMLWRNISQRRGGGTRTAAPIWMLPLAGAVGGGCAGFFTIGGGVATIPILTAFFGMSQTAAQGLALAMMAPGSMVALMTYAHLDLVIWSIGIPMSLGSIVTISHGVALAHKLPERKLRAIFAVMLFVSAVMMLSK